MSEYDIKAFIAVFGFFAVLGGILGFIWLMAWLGARKERAEELVKKAQRWRGEYRVVTRRGDTERYSVEIMRGFGICSNLSWNGLHHDNKYYSFDTLYEAEQKADQLITDGDNYKKECAEREETALY